MPSGKDVALLFFENLRKKNDVARNEAAHDLFKFVTGEFKESPSEFQEEFLTHLDERVIASISGLDNNERKGAILAMVCLVQVDNGSSRPDRFLNNLRNILPPQQPNTLTDVAVIELAAKAVGQVILASGNQTASRVELFIKHLLHKITEHYQLRAKDEHECLPIIFALRELAVKTPTYFYQYHTEFFRQTIFKLVRDPKAYIRVEAVSALRAALVVYSQRESKQEQKDQVYKTCYDESVKSLENQQNFGGRGDDAKDASAHSGFLIMNELLRISSADFEKAFQQAHDMVLRKNIRRPWESKKSRFGTLGSLNARQKEQENVIESLLKPFKPSSFESRTCRAQTELKYDKMCELTMRYLHCRTSSMVQVLLQVIPRLASFKSDEFRQKYLSESLNFILANLGDKEKSLCAFVALGLTVNAVRLNLSDELRFRVFDALRRSLRGDKKNKSFSPEPAVFICIYLIVKTVPDLKETKSNRASFADAAKSLADESRSKPVEVFMQEELKQMLPSMFACGLSTPLITALKEIVKQLPVLREDIHKGLLSQLSMILLQMPLPDKLQPPSPMVFKHVRVDEQRIPATTLALQVLNVFEFTRHMTQMFLQCVAESFLNSEHMAIRREAVVTCCQLLIPFINVVKQITPRQSQLTMMKLIHDVLRRVLTVGITDDVADIRICVFLSVTAKFDPHLAQPENLKMIFMALHDEGFEIREAVVCLLGRLSDVNPAYVMPELRILLLQILNELDWSGQTRNKEQSAILLSHLIASARNFVKPYFRVMLKSLVPKLNEPDAHSDFISNVLLAIGEIAQAGGGDLLEYADSLFPTLVTFLSDYSNNQKRHIALKTLGLVAQSTGYVVTVYQDHPKLLEILLRFLKTEQDAIVRREVLKVLGILGALDPYKHKVYTGRVDSAANSTGLALSIAEPKHVVSSTDVKQDIIQWFQWERGSLEDYYPTITIVHLMQIMKDPNLERYHSKVVNAVPFIFERLGSKSVTYLDQVIPVFTSIMQTDFVTGTDRLINALRRFGEIVTIVKHHIKPYLRDIFLLIKTTWQSDDVRRCEVKEALVQLVGEIAKALGSDFQPYVPDLMPYMLKVLSQCNDRFKLVIKKMLTALKICSPTLKEYLNMIIPPIVRLFEPANQDSDAQVKAEALVTLDCFTDSSDLSRYASRILPALIRLFQATDTSLVNHEVISEAFSLLVSLMIQMTSGFILYEGKMTSVLIHRYKETSSELLRYRRLLNLIRTSGRIAEYDDVNAKRHATQRTKQRLEISQRTEPPPQPSSSSMSHGTGEQSQDALVAAFNTLKCKSKEDYSQWLNNLSIEMLKQSPQYALKACGNLAKDHNQLAKDLFNASFISCWTALKESNQNSCGKFLAQAVGFEDYPELTQTILNLAEFIEHSDKAPPLPIDPNILKDRAIKTGAFAKALRYTECQIILHQDNPGNIDPHFNLVDALESLIEINYNLQLEEEASGVVEFAKASNIPELKESWFEKLREWEKALDMYSKKLETSEDIELKMGRMRCLKALGEWDQLNETAVDMWTSGYDVQLKIATMAAAAVWGMEKYEDMEEYVELINRNNYDGAWFRAVDNVKAGHDDRKVKIDYLSMAKFTSARKCIDKARDLLDTELTALASESYSRAYSCMINAQMLTELEEAIEYSLVEEKRPIIEKTWWKRIHGVQDSVEHWQDLLQIRALVLEPSKMQHSKIKFVSLCRKRKKPKLALKTLTELLKFNPEPESNRDRVFAAIQTDPEVVFSYAKYMWSKIDDTKELSQKRCAIQLVTRISESVINKFASLNRGFSVEPSAAYGAGQGPANTAGELAALSRLASKCLLKRGLWSESVAAPFDLPSDNLPAFNKAKDWSNQWYKAWHCLAKCHFDSVEFYKRLRMVLLRVLKDDTSGKQFIQDHGIPLALTQMSPVECDRKILEHATHAVVNFFHSIRLSTKGNLQDILRLLTIMFEHGDAAEVHERISSGLNSVPNNTWLQVIPQLMARIDTPRSRVSTLIQRILNDVGREHPQALIYPLTVASKSAAEKRKTVALEILKTLSSGSKKLVEDAQTVSQELIRVAILWHELWHEGLEEASKQYFAERNVNGMLKTLEPLHQMIELGPTTAKEQSFFMAYQSDLHNARQCCRRYSQTNNTKELATAWDSYYAVFKKISKELPQLTSLDLQFCSPHLMACRDLELAVPGTYDPSRPIIRIQSVHRSLSVISSKQRPRKVTIRGSDGKDYLFLLKGHEDPRQDERVMQLFGLINSLLLQDGDTCRSNLTIQRYSIVPLSPNSGLIGWVPHCDTLHTLLRDYRERKKILLNIEHKIMQKMSQEYERLTLMQKVEVFEFALSSVKGEDLAKIIWLKSPSSEVWFDRRTNYTRSLAVMSMVGYILGLGDRHPSNLMLDRMSGKVVHIDFGDCFEVAMSREKFPEKIPFRLTRMLIKAMEVTGIDGNYKTTCERVMKVLRENKDSLMAVLEAFVYDPLINWRLVANKPDDKKKTFNDEDMAYLAYRTHNVLQQEQPIEMMDKTAIETLARIKEKLTGNDFVGQHAIDIKTQVEYVINQATSNENLCQCYIGWCPFW